MLADLSLATRLTMVTLIPIVAMMTVGGPAIGSALFAYGNFGEVDAGYLGMAITLSAFTLIPYALVLLQLRVFYARQQPWTPIVLIVVITAVKIAASLAAPHLTDDPELVAGYLGLANGLGFLAGATVGYVLLRAHLDPPGGRLVSLEVVRTILVTIAASLVAGTGRPRHRPAARAGGADPQLGRRRFAAAPGRARSDHGADHRRGDAGRQGARSARRRWPRCGGVSAGARRCRTPRRAARPTAVGVPPHVR